MKSFRTRFCAWLLLFVVAAGIVGAAEAPVRLFPVEQGGKWGFIDEKGAVVIEPTYDCAWDFSEGLACVQVGDLRGYIDPGGKMVVEPKYVLAWGFHEGLAAVATPAGRFGKTINKMTWCYIDKTGKVAIPPIGPAKWGESFSEGMARYKSYGSGFAPSIYLNHARRGFGFFKGIRDFHEGLAAGSRRRTWGYLNKSCKFVIEPRFHKALDFSEGLAPVMSRKRLAGKNRRGRPKYAEQWGYIDKTGKIVLEMKYERAQSFSEGLAGVRLGGKWGAIDKTGKTVIEPAYEYLAPFSEGLARVVAGGKTGYIDKTGQVVIPPAFDVGWEFSKGLARVIVGGKTGYIDKGGKYVWRPTK